MYNVYTLRFWLFCLAGVVGIYLYDGTLTKAVVWFVIFWLVGRLSGLGYHRWLTHKQFEPGPIGKFFLFWSMVSIGTARPLDYVVVHRTHHKYSETDLDPHPRSLGMWKMASSMYRPVQLNVPIKDILRRPDVMFVNKYYWSLYLAHLSFLFAIDYQVAFLSFLLLNVVDVLLTAWFNCYAHDDRGPVNLPWWANYFMFTGENLHLNHHNDPSNPNFGATSKYNIDFLYYVIKYFLNPKTIRDK